MDNRLFGGALPVIEKALAIRQARQGVLQSNIANMEVPGYRRRELDFAEVMEKSLSGSGNLVRTNPRHLPPPDEGVSSASHVRRENRPVDLDEEMLALSENQLLYEISARLAAKRFEGLKYAIDEGSK